MIKINIEKENRSKEIKMTETTHNSVIRIELWNASILQYLENTKIIDEIIIVSNELFVKRCEDDGKWNLFKQDDVGELSSCSSSDFEKLYLGFENDVKIPRKTFSAFEVWAAISIAKMSRKISVIMMN